MCSVNVRQIIIFHEDTKNVYEAEDWRAKYLKINTLGWYHEGSQAEDLMRTYYDKREDDQGWKTGLGEEHP